MKTNKERSEVILQRYKSEQKISNETVKQEVFETKHKKKFVWNMKSLISVCAACVMVLTLGLGLGLGLGLSGNNSSPGQNDNNAVLNLNNAYVVNFNEYSAIGAGALGGVDTTTGARVSIQSNKSGQRHKLIGVRYDGRIEELKFKRNEHDEAKPFPWSVYSIHSLKNFTVVCLRKGDTSGGTRFIMSIPNDTGILEENVILIDNKTGKIYSLEKLVSEKHISYYLYINDLFDVYYDSNTDLCESESSFFFKIETTKSNKYYKATVIDGELEIKQIIDQSNFVDFKSLIVDKYGNVFLGQRKGELTTETSKFYASYCVTTTGELKKIELSVCRALNGIVYTTDKTKQFNSEGDLVENNFLNCNFYQKRANLIKRVGNIEYYFGTRQDPYYYSKKDTIYKVTWKNDVEFDVEENVLTDFEEDFVVTADKIFFRNETKIYSVDIVTGQKEDLTSEYFFTSIETDNLGNVVFVGLDSSMQNVTGLIRNDGTVEASVTASEYKVYYIKALG